MRVTESELKERMEDTFSDIGTLKVTRSGECSSFTWDIFWTSKGGNHPQLEVDGAKIRGRGAAISVSTQTDGHLFMAPIPGEFLRVASPKPQVWEIFCKIFLILEWNVLLTKLNIVTEVSRTILCGLSKYCMGSISKNAS